MKCTEYQKDGVRTKYLGLGEHRVRRREGVPRMRSAEETMMYVHGVPMIGCGQSSKEGWSKVYQGYYEDGASSMRMNMKYPSSSSELVRED